MNTETPAIETSAPSKKNRIWAIWQIHFSSFFGGPFGGCYLMSQNAKLFGDEKLAKKILLAGFLGTTLLFLTLFCIPEHIVDHIPTVIIPLAYSTIISGYASRTQKSDVKEFLEEGKKRHSFFRLLFNTLWLAATTIVYAFICLFFVEFVLGL